MSSPVSVELCAGAGGQALGLERAGFSHDALIDNDAHCCRTLKANRPSWNVIEASLAAIKGTQFKGIDLLAGGLPCPPFSLAGKQLGKNDERDLFPHALRLIEEAKPKAVMIENVRGFLGSNFESYRARLFKTLHKMGYQAGFKLFNALDFGVPQKRSRTIIIAIKRGLGEFSWPHPLPVRPPFVGDVLYDLMAERGWKQAAKWRAKAQNHAPTLVGGSMKHGGPDLGPTRARKEWALLGVDGLGLADEAPSPDFEGMPRLTVRMAARLQGFPDSWQVTGKKTPSYKQVGNAFPSPVACAVGKQIAQALVKSPLNKAA